MDARRPDPDALLRRLQADGEAAADGARGGAARRGRLKVFLGMSAGVGKTFEMLREALDLRARGVDVVAGYVEPHGRVETERMLDGLEALPHREIAYAGTTVREFDLDAALARRPAVCLVDELAHSNAEGSRHPKRWQDVEELLAAGIDVYTTVNVQHVESLRDVVARITGVVVREAVPDRVLEAADAVEVVDVSPGELVRRLDAGKIYPPERARQARQRFFTEQNLTALRQIALRFVADRVDARMETLRRATPAPATWAARERVLVCVSPSPAAAGLVRAAKRLAGGLQAPLFAVFVEPPGGMAEAARARVDETMRLAAGLGAETAVVGGLDPVAAILDYARRENITRLVVGKPTHPRWRDRLGGSFLDAVVRESGPIEVLVTAGEAESGAPAARPRERPTHRRSPALHYAAAAGAVGAAAGVAFPFSGVLGLADVAMLMLLAVLGVALRLGRGPSALAAVVAALATNFLFIPPLFTFLIQPGYALTFVGMLVVALVVAALAARSRDIADAARERERRTDALYRLARDLVAVQRTPEVLKRTLARVGETFAVHAVALLPDEDGRLQSVIAHGGPARLPAKEEAVAAWTYAHGLPAGRRTDTLAAADGLYLPFVAGGQPLGVLALFLPEGRALASDERALIEAFTNQAALALKRSDLAGWIWPSPSAPRPALPSTAALTTARA